MSLLSPTDTTCTTCCWYVPINDAEGRCRAHAPYPEGFPFTHPTNWCGDWTRTPTPLIGRHDR